MSVQTAPDLVLSGTGPTTRIAHAGTGIVRDYFADAGARARLLVLSAVLSYAGGAAMFWLHAVYRGERGPAIANQWHWMLDSSLGFLSLTPVLVLILPMARELAAGRGRRIEATITGALFAVITTPGPILHDLVAGQGTPLAHLATRVFGRDPGVIAAHLHAVEHSGSSEALLQLAVGLPVYILLSHLTTAALARRAAGPPAESRGQATSPHDDADATSALREAA
jgi:hypothetical protein